ncbi:hypothetical protein NDU88_001820 [Pleurodeles waltl]|uniref:Uncharacterized protein n=1 Tax=Pleurodeles waltl TaxID=8319 RepID=A0AAV7KR54_PLEWA|nr:hypothetical protein NDU88_001820 [Pleurodeles waltl]
MAPKVPRCSKGRGGAGVNKRRQLPPRQETIANTGLNQAVKPRGPHSEKGPPQAEGACLEAGLNDVSAVKHGGGPSIADIFKAPSQTKRSATLPGKEVAYMVSSSLRDQQLEAVNSNPNEGTNADQTVRDLSVQPETVVSSSQVSVNVYDSIFLASEVSPPLCEHDLN